MPTRHTSIDLKQLEYFLAVANSGSFTRASTRLGVDQSALSKQIRRLEIQLRQSLFRRHGRGTALTPAGELALRHANKVLNAVAELEEGVSSARGSLRGKVVIGTPATARRALKGFVSAFRSRFPEASLEVVEARSRVTYEGLLEGNVDIGILLDRSLTRGVETVALPGEALYLVSRPEIAPAPASVQVPFKMLAGLPLILADEMDAVRELVEAEAKRSRIGLRIVLQAQGGQLILDLVQQGHGHAVLPASSVDLTNAGPLQLNEIVRPRLMRGRFLAVAAQRPQTRLLSETRALLERYLGTPSPKVKT